MFGVLDSSSGSKAAAEGACNAPAVEYRKQSHTRRLLLWTALITALGAALGCAWRLFFYVQPMPLLWRRVAPVVSFERGRTIIRMPNGNLVAQVGDYSDELTAYLRFDYLKGIASLAHAQIYLVTREDQDRPRYELYIRMPNDMVQATTILGDLVIAGRIAGYALKSPPTIQITRWKKETQLFDEAYRQPVRDKLLQLPRSALTSAVASFILFKVRTDRRVQERLEPVAGKELTSEDARNFAADMIAVAGFYHIPLDMLLGIGAMENNYLDVRGDLQHAVWKRRAQPGDIVLRRQRGRVLVSNYSIGPWQITRETLRYAHSLYLRDKRDYSELPPRLRPPRRLELNHVSTDVLTTYAGLLLRNLLDYYHGDVQKAEGAYNGGRGNPNLDYSKGVAMVASYARRVVGMAAGRKGNAVLESRLVVTHNRDGAKLAATH